jgi:hypothetical protein
MFYHEKNIELTNSPILLTNYLKIIEKNKKKEIFEEEEEIKEEEEENNTINFKKKMNLEKYFGEKENYEFEILKGYNIKNNNEYLLEKNQILNEKKINNDIINLKNIDSLTLSSSSSSSSLKNINNNNNIQNNNNNNNNIEKNNNNNNNNNIENEMKRKNSIINQKKKSPNNINKKNENENLNPFNIYEFEKDTIFNMKNLKHDLGQWSHIFPRSKNGYNSLVIYFQ